MDQNGPIEKLKSNQTSRKQRTLLTRTTFNQITQLGNTEKPKQILTITNININTIYKVLKLYDESDKKLRFSDYNKKKGKKKIDKSDLLQKIVEIVGNDNSITQIKVMEKLKEKNIKVSKTEIFKLFKNANLTRKRIKKNLTESHKQIIFYRIIGKYTNEDVVIN
ncbi:hypothetical protein A3Q56_01788 [Intoshia linei]|uniref:Transposase Tc1-like domain-containing protein n=1 Tax=Intoshia linei TaxID=1819745 RepID=A0A177BA89_9BILA|nr:hypothetical protein A3Q56_01788 [Intoshia linei]